MPLPTGSPRTPLSPPSSHSALAPCLSAAETPPVAGMELTSLVKTSLLITESLVSGSLPQSTKVTAAMRTVMTLTTTSTPLPRASNVAARTNDPLLHRRLADAWLAFCSLSSHSTPRQTMYTPDGARDVDGAADMDLAYQSNVAWAI